MVSCLDTRGRLLEDWCTTLRPRWHACHCSRRPALTKRTLRTRGQPKKGSPDALAFTVRADFIPNVR